MTTGRAVERDVKAVEKFLDFMDDRPPRLVRLIGGSNIAGHWVVECDRVAFYTQERMESGRVVDAYAGAIYIEAAHDQKELPHVVVDFRQATVDAEHSVISSLVTLRVTRLLT